MMYVYPCTIVVHNNRSLSRSLSWRCEDLWIFVVIMSIALMFYLFLNYNVNILLHCHNVLVCCDVF